MKAHIVYLEVIIFFSLIGMKALFHPGLFTAHDIYHQVVRLHYYFQALNDGQFPPIWIGQLAERYGYPLFLFSYHLPWMIGSLFMKLGTSLEVTIKSLFFISYLGSGLTMYFFINNLLRNRLAALVSSILYLWVPYHFLIIFVSASMGIAFIFAFLPLSLLGINLIYENKRIGIPLLSIGIAGIILSHIMHLIFLSPVILLFIIWRLLDVEKKLIFLKKLFLGLLLGVLICSFYLLPATYYRSETKVNSETGFTQIYKRHFINFKQLVYSKWGVNPIVNNAKDGEISFQLGIAQWISVFVTLLLLTLKKLHMTTKKLSIFMLSGFLFCAVMMLDYSKLVWGLLVKVATVDYPFRFLLPTVFIASTCAAIALSIMKKKLQLLFSVFLIFIAFYTNRNHINVNQYTNLPLETYLKSPTEVTTNTFNEYLPIKASSKLLNKPWNEVVGDNITAINTKQSTNWLAFDLDVKKDTTATLGQFYFPGQILYINGEARNYQIGEDGRLNFTILPGQYYIEVKYEETSLIKASKILSLIGLLLLFLTLKQFRLNKSHLS